MSKTDLDFEKLFVASSVYREACKHLSPGTYMESPLGTVVVNTYIKENAAAFDAATTAFTWMAFVPYTQACHKTWLLEKTKPNATSSDIIDVLRKLKKEKSILLQKIIRTEDDFQFRIVQREDNSPEFLIIGYKVENGILKGTGLYCNTRTREIIKGFPPCYMGNPKKCRSLMDISPESDSIFMNGVCRAIASVDLLGSVITPYRTQTEIAYINKVMKYMNSDILTVISAVDDDFDDDAVGSRIATSVFVDLDIPTSCVEISLSKREINRCYDEIEKIDGSVNLIDVFKNPRYGKDYTMKYENRRFTMVWAVTKSPGNALIIYFVEKIGDMEGVISAVIEHPEAYDGNITAIHTFIRINGDFTRMPYDFAAYDLHYENYVDIVNNFLSVMIMMHLKPTKYCEVHKSTSAVHAEKTTDTPRTSNTEKCAVYRLMVTRSTGKKLCSNSGNRADAVYTMPEWDRSGYVRTLASGKTIYINPTHCVRHKELSATTKKIIKL